MHRVKRPGWKYWPDFSNALFSGEQLYLEVRIPPLQVPRNRGHARAGTSQHNLVEYDGDDVGIESQRERERETE